jgi:hypothetical protein
MANPLLLEIVVPLYFLDRSERWETIKPYNFQYVPKESIPLHNLLRSAYTTLVRSMRPIVPTLSLDAQGFEVHRLETKMTYSDFKSKSAIDAVYARELEGYFKQALGAKQVRALDFQVCPTAKMGLDAVLLHTNLVLGS